MAPAPRSPRAGDFARENGAAFARGGHLSCASLTYKADLMPYSRGLKRGDAMGADAQP